MRDGWVVKQLEAVCTKFGAGPFGSNMKVSTFVDMGIPVVSGNHMTELELVEKSFNYITEDHANSMQSSIVQRNDVVITKAGTIGQVSLIPENSRFLRYVLSSRQLFVRPNPEIVLPKYLAIYLKYGRGQVQILSNVNRTGVPSLSQAVSFIKNVRIELPSLPEQKRIVNLISSVDSYIKALQYQLECARRSRDAVLQELLAAGGDGWVEHKLADIFNIYQPQTIAKSLMSDDAEFVVFGANGPIGRYHDFNHEEREVVVTCRGATCGTINMTPEKTWITGNAMVVSPKSLEVSKDFLYWALTSGVDIHSVISGSAQPQITREGLSPVRIKIPPKAIQNHIVELINSFQASITNADATLRESINLRTSLLSDLLSGNHEIPASYDKVMGAHQ